MELKRPTRYPLHGKVQLVLPERRVVTGRTVDISVGGLCIMLEQPIAIGAAYPLRFEMNIAGQTHLVTALAQPVYGVFASQGGFRVGLAFKEKDAQRTALIESLAGKRPMVRTKEESGARSVPPGAP
jgi:hypothetical protein